MFGSYKFHIRVNQTNIIRTGSFFETPMVAFKVLINDTFVFYSKSTISVCVHYAFVYRGLLIIRLTSLSEDGFLTVVLDSNSSVLCIYSTDIISGQEIVTYGDKSIHMKLSLLLKEV